MLTNTIVLSIILYSHDSQEAKVFVIKLVWLDCWAHYWMTMEMAIQNSQNSEKMRREKERNPDLKNLYLFYFQNALSSDSAGSVQCSAVSLVMFALLLSEPERGERRSEYQEERTSQLVFSLLYFLFPLDESKKDGHLEGSFDSRSSRPLLLMFSQTKLMTGRIVWKWKPGLCLMAAQVISCLRYDNVF